MNLAALALAPEASEYNPYYGRYISLVKTDNIVATLETQVQETLAILRRVDESKANHRYAPEKWTVKDVLGHMSDTERIFAYRALRISRNDKTPIEGFEQDDYVRSGPFCNCRWSDLVDEFGAIRRTTVFLFRGLSEEAWSRRGTASDYEVSVRALAHIIAGHELHHRKVLKEKYGIS
ncbi:MAG TPA: DinB family protein [Terriglobales bacterium]|nr:DinB family protein [Terriglobales bacterium]